MLNSLVHVFCGLLCFVAASRIDRVIAGTWVTTLDREYVYGPGDVNEFVAQFKHFRQLYYYLQDGSLNDTGVADFAGNLKRQYVYAPYGECIVAEATGDAPYNRVGFQGMFIDVQNVFQANRNVTPGPGRHYLTANRVYDPPTGRWLQRDPNETAQPIVEALAFNGGGLSLSSQMFDIVRHYGDGPNSYQFVRSNPMNLRDPLGLNSADFDWLDEAGDIVASSAGERAAFAQEVLDFGFGVLRAGGKLALIAAASAIIPGAGLAFAAVGAFQSGVDIYENGLGWGNGLGLVANLAGVGGEAAKFAARFSASLAAMRGRYAAKGGLIVTEAIDHHMVPLAVLKKLDSSVANNPAVRGAAGSPNVVRIPKPVHDTLHFGKGTGGRGGRWNRDWWDELDKIPGGVKNAQVSDVLSIKDMLINRYDLRDFVK